MNQNEWNKTATEQNAKAEQIGAGIAVGGCLLFVVGLVIFLVASYAICGDGC